MAIRSNLSVVILAAGKGTRMKSEKAKVLHEVFGRPMVHHVLHAISPLHPGQIIAVVGHQRGRVEQALDAFDVELVVQQEQQGTGHAVLVTEKFIQRETDTVMILCGDTPLIRPETLQEMFTAHQQAGADLTLMTTILDDPTNYGRIITDNSGQVTGIVEQKDASPEQQQINEINAGIYCVDRKFLYQALETVGTNNSQGEVYLTDIVAIAVSAGKKVEKYFTTHAIDVLGVNSRVELSLAHSELQQRRNNHVMLSGVTIESPETVHISAAATVGRDCLLRQGVHIEGSSTIKENCRIDQGALLTDCTVGANVIIGAYSVLTGCTIQDDTVVPPFSRES